MPISGPTSYVPTVEEFLGHWLSVDTALGAGNELVLPGAVNRAALQTRLDALVAKQADVQAKINAEEIARGDIEIRRSDLLTRANQFNDKVRALLPGSKWVRALPNVPTINESQGKFVQPLDDIGNLWGLINADPAIPDIVLLGGYVVATYLTDVTGLKSASTALNLAGSNSKVAREERNDIQDDIHAVLVSYRQLMPTHFAKTHALVESLPKLTPDPGSTPDAVTANGVWDVASGMARITWTASTNTNLAQYEVRFCAGPNYSTENESVAASIAPGGTLEVLIDHGLPTPGSVATYRVYVITSTGNEKGSNTVEISRP